jgi:hypothetical protein
MKQQPKNRLGRSLPRPKDEPEAAIGSCDRTLLILVQDEDDTIWQSQGDKLLPSRGLQRRKFLQGYLARMRDMSKSHVSLRFQRGYQSELIVRTAGMAFALLTGEQ